MLKEKLPLKFIDNVKKIKITAIYNIYNQKSKGHEPMTVYISREERKKKICNGIL